MNLFQLQDAEFLYRHIGPNHADTEKMLNTIGVDSIETLMNQTIPASIRLKKPLQLPDAMSEQALLNQLQQIAQQNKLYKTYIGQGYYNTITPSVILRNIFENPGWYTQYTPYQAEISQGRLESLLNFQTMVTDLTGLEIANASLLDEATAAAEAMTMLYHQANKTEQVSRNKFFVDDAIFVQTKDVLMTRANPLEIELVFGNFATALLDDTFFGAIVQYPAANGTINDYRGFIANVHAVGAYAVIATDLLALTLLTPPGELGADVAIGSAQRFGVPLGYGGPHAAFFATKDEFKRNMPGRLIGVSVDAQGNRALRMALQTREQHIKREKATSNICTAQALLANMAAMYAVYHGPKGLKNIAKRIHLLTVALKNTLEALNYTIEKQHFFDTIQVKANAKLIQSIAEQHHINLFYSNENTVSIALDETTTREDVVNIAMIFAAAQEKDSAAVVFETAFNEQHQIPEFAQRHSAYLTHPVFNTHHSETQMMRYIKQLEQKDLSLNISMISLGSCTMKLNAATEMMPVSWPAFSQLHPFVPINQAAGYHQVIKELKKYLCVITGFADCSLQPNSGAQGEYAGLLTIRKFHEANNNSHRNVVLIPISAHGTNPASAVMAGMKVVVVKGTAEGHIDVNDLKEKAEMHQQDLAGLMVTYPSTHGVFEESIKEICAIIHENGGLVYMDGANMNAQVSLTSPAEIGADVCHLNLHKTFAIPHGGGGPGVGPICVTAQLAPFLPGHTIYSNNNNHGSGAVSAAPVGSASILLISYAYIKMLGAHGVKMATEYAILNANYMKARLEPYFKILYTGTNGFAAHEFIVDLRPYKQTAGIEAEDVAKRLMDYGFHAPTMSFPVPGTIMIEPTESEDKAELDRFCDALIAIHNEIKAIESGELDAVDNPLKNAPHTQLMVAADTWNHSYSRQQAAFPLFYVTQNKFWPSVARINNTYGDRNLICTCEPIESYMEK
ncbi:MAG: glycine dehydrogenase (aminomethyl-transferring) [Sphingobacteriales bacterium]|uniref:aminomethyl-transferring glycine dehydrogenase n=1 Tax=Hydrotalea flava TaxID=714549 RepID=UPI00082B9829|nr:aminomethyl-transferring glycine dehydrogenase [Hydrotalea flava]RTL52090.1 MAG: glycine dehydrogenase (aminomethyl-transferring) [Sphingobacteriales bacterium]